MPRLTSYKVIFLLVCIPFFLWGCGEKDKGISIDDLQDKGVNGFFEKNQEVGYTGKVFKLHKNGQVMLKGQLIEGKADGLWTEWYEDGQKKAEDNRKNGKREGLLVVWYPNGQKQMELTRKDDKIDGKWTEWYENGHKKSESNYENGKKWNSHKV